MENIEHKKGPSEDNPFLIDMKSQPNFCRLGVCPHKLHKARQDQLSKDERV